MMLLQRYVDHLDALEDLRLVARRFNAVASDRT